MEENAEQAAKTVDRAEKELLTSVALKDPTYSGLDHLLAKFRNTCSNFIFLDFQAASKKNIEARLWAAHGKVNHKFRPLLANFREGEGKKKHVERRKAEKLYLDFIKASMKFYRGYIQRLASHFQDVPEVFEIARKFGLDTLSADTPVAVDLQHKRMVLRSCHATLIQLGDLSRYRETELNLNKRNWGPAKGYYDLASALDPTSGQSFNQLAVISLADKDHLRAVYYLYRAVTVKHPTEPTRGNLELEFKKLRTQHARNLQQGAAATDLATRFITFHAYCYGGDALANLEEQRSDILRQLADDLRERPFDTIINKICLINIAAEFCSRQRAGEPTQESSEATKRVAAFQKLQSLNIATFCVLLRLLLDELQTVAKENEGKTPTLSETPAQVSAATRRILPHLRLYSAWLLSNAGFMLQPACAASIGVDLHNLWQVYTEAMSLLVAAFPLRELPEIDYLLEEDHDTSAFVPFSEEAKQLHFYTPGGLSKPSFGDLKKSATRVPEDEMLCRIKDLVRDAVYMCRHRDDFGPRPIPLVFGEGRFVFIDEQLPYSSQISNVVPSHHGHANSVDSVSRDDIDAARRSHPNGYTSPVRANPENISDAGVSGSAPSAMENMVNDLVQSESSDAVMADGPPTPTLRTPTFETPGPHHISQSQSNTMTAQDLVRQMQQHPGGMAMPAMGLHNHNRPPLPSILNTAFAPRPGETPGSSPRPGTARQLEPGLTSAAQRSSALFQEEILQRQHAIQARASPMLSLESTLPSLFESSPGMYTSFQVQNGAPSAMSPWPSSAPHTPGRASANAPKQTPGSMFGAIGEPRRHSEKTPTSGQPG